MDGYGKCHSCARFGTDECPTSSKCLAFDERLYFKPKIKKRKISSLDGSVNMIMNTLISTRSTAV